MTILVGKGASDGGSVDVDFEDDALYAPYAYPIVMWPSSLPVQVSNKEESSTECTSNVRNIVSVVIGVVDGIRESYRLFPNLPAGNVCSPYHGGPPSNVIPALSRQGSIQAKTRVPARVAR
jgi:hypothetical protein